MPKAPMSTYNSRRLHRTGTIAALALLIACGQGESAGQDADSGDETEQREFTQRTFDNRGAVCLSPREDAALAIDVVFDICLSSSCNQADAATCTAVLEDDRLVISSQVTFTSEVSPNGDCTADCGGSIGVACGVIEPAASSIGVVYGSRRSNVVTLPLSGDTLVYDNGSIGVCPPLDTYFER